MGAAEDSWLRIAFRRSVVARSYRVALVVGTALALINHGDSILVGSAGPATWSKIALTYCVPYCVSTYAAVSAVRDAMRRAARHGSGLEATGTR